MSGDPIVAAVLLAADLKVQQIPQKRQREEDEDEGSGDLGLGAFFSAQLRFVVGFSRNMTDLEMDLVVRVQFDAAITGVLICFLAPWAYAQWGQLSKAKKKRR